MAAKITAERLARMVELGSVVTDRTDIGDGRYMVTLRWTSDHVTPGVDGGRQPLELVELAQGRVSDVTPPEGAGDLPSRDGRLDVV